jgi:penicillin-binding protein 1A
MAWGRKKSGGRKEPQFGLAASLAELRLGPRDRVAAGDEAPKKSSPKRKVSAHDPWISSCGWPAKRAAGSDA